MVSNIQQLGRGRSQSHPRASSKRRTDTSVTGKGSSCHADKRSLSRIVEAAESSEAAEASHCCAAVPIWRLALSACGRKAKHNTNHDVNDQDHKALALSTAIRMMWSYKDAYVSAALLVVPTCSVNTCPIPEFTSARVYFVIRARCRRGTTLQGRRTGLL